MLLGQTSRHSLARQWSERMQRNTSSKISFRSVFVSDVHLGSRDCRATEWLEFLAVTTASSAGTALVEDTNGQRARLNLPTAYARAPQPALK
jgi:hypothetical protein